MAAGFALTCLAATVLAAPRAATPNVLMIQTDDQDATMGSLDYMPKLQKLLMAKGTTYQSHYCTISLCCPSRVSLWTGKAAHNTNVTDINPPYGGYPKFISEGWNDDWLPVWIRDAGYNMYYSGKLMNAHNINNYDNPFPNGFAGTRFFLDPYTYTYFNPIIQKNQEAPVNYPGNYSTDLLADQTVELIDEAVAAGKPFVVAANPVGPHSFQHQVNGTGVSDPPQAAPRHDGLFANYTVPRTANFNPDRVSAAGWVAQLDKLNQTKVDYNDHWFSKRLEALQAVDDMVETLVNRLSHHGILDNTYIIFTSDNGFHLSQHRLPPGKSTGYEEDINVPLVIRGPGVPAGETVDVVTSHTDLVPTILTMMGLSLDHALDGAAVPYTAAEIEDAESSKTRQEQVNIEFWGKPTFGGPFKYPAIKDAYNTYKGVRVVGKDYSFYYQVWCFGTHELYDMTNDVGQMNNLINSTATLLGRPTPQVLHRLDALLLVLKTCKEDVCIKPWAQLHPDGDVANLKDALAKKYDEFYANQAKVRWDQCEYGYIKEVEGPMWDSDGLLFQRGDNMWPDWT